MVKIRLKRLGRRHENAFRVCVMDIRRPRDGREIEVIGHYKPDDPETARQLVIKADRAVHWLGVGAQPSQTVRSLLKKAGVPLPVKRGKGDKPTAAPAPAQPAPAATADAAAAATPPPAAAP